MQRRSVDVAPQQACALVGQVLRVSPSALTIDLDGALSPIVSAPGEEDCPLTPPVGVAGLESSPELTDRAHAVLAKSVQVEVLVEKVVRALG